MHSILFLSISSLIAFTILAFSLIINRKFIDYTVIITVVLIAITLIFIGYFQFILIRSSKQKYKKPLSKFSKIDLKEIYVWPYFWIVIFIMSILVGIWVLLTITDYSTMIRTLLMGIFLIVYGSYRLVELLARLAVANRR
jgi:hypothetical protein